MTSLFITKEKMEEIRNDDKAIAREIKRELKKHFPELKVSASNKAVYGMYITFDNEVVSDEKVRNIVGHFSALTSATLWVNSSICYYSHTDQYKEEQRREYEKQQEEMRIRREANEKLYSDNVTIEVLTEYKIVDLDRDVFVKALQPSINKNNWKIKNDEYIDEESYIGKYKVTRIVEMNEESYNYFCFNLLEDFDFLSQTGGTEYDEESNTVLYGYAVAVICEGKETIIVDAQGYSYAQYTCRLVEDINGKLQEVTETKVKEETTVFNDRLNQIIDTELYTIIENGSWFKGQRIDELLNDARYVLYDCYGTSIITTGKAYKELINECNATIKPIELMYIDRPDLTFDGIRKYDLGLIGALGMKDDPRLKAIKWGERLQRLLLESGSDIQTLLDNTKNRLEKEAKRQTEQSKQPEKTVTESVQNSTDTTVVEVIFNQEKNGIELHFASKPSKGIREMIGINGQGFRYHRVKNMWYAKDTEERREFIKALCDSRMESENPNNDTGEVITEPSQEYGEVLTETQEQDESNSTRKVEEMENNFDDLLGKFDDININESLLTDAEVQQMSDNQEIYYKCLASLNNMLKEMEQLEEMEKEYNSNYIKGSFGDTSCIKYLDIDSRCITKTIEQLTNRFIGDTVSLIERNRNITIDKNVLTGDLNKANEELSYSTITEKAFDQLEGMTPQEKAKQELKEKFYKKTQRGYNKDYSTIKGKKVTLKDYLWFEQKWSGGNRLSYGSEEKLNVLLTALTDYEINEQRNMYAVIQDKIRDGDTEKHHALNEKLDYIKTFLNGRVDIVFNTAQQAQEFYSEYCCYGE